MVKRQLYQQTIIIPSSSSSYEPNNPNQLFFWFGPLYILMQYKKQRENFVKETNRKKGSLFDLPSFQFIMN